VPTIFSNFFIFFANSVVYVKMNLAKSGKLSSLIFSLYLVGSLTQVNSRLHRLEQFKVDFSEEANGYAEPNTGSIP
jgi:hypothetical protein